MTKQDIIAHIKQPSTLTKQTLNDYQKLVKQFPFSSTIWMLYLKNLQLENDIEFDHMLRKGAISCTNRTKLFQLIHLPQESSNPVSEKPVIELNLEKKSQKPQDESSTNHVNTDIRPSKERQKSTASEAKELEKEYLKEAVNSSILKEVSKLQQSEENTNKNKVPEKKEINTKSKEEKISDLINANKSMSFDQWVSILNKGTNIEETTNKKSIDKKKDKKNFSEDFDQLIAHFLENEPAIKPQKKAFYSPVNMARMSVTEDPELITETLALIYMQQGNYQKALDAYQKLSLKYPEKSSYFANQIKIIKQKLKL